MSVMFRRKRSVLRSIINNNEKEGCQVCNITDDLLFLQNKKCTNCREMNTMRGLSRKLYLDLSVPTEEDQRSDQQRILEALSAEGVKEEVHIPVRMLRQLYPLLDRAGWKITVSLSWNGEKWELVDIESCQVLSDDESPISQDRSFHILPWKAVSQSGHVLLLPAPYEWFFPPFPCHRKI